jgi:amidophosphoribosyltransferase
MPNLALPSDDLKHECAIYVAYGGRTYAPRHEKYVIENVIKGLLAQSNRGQEGFGVASIDPEAQNPFTVFRSGRSINSLMDLSSPDAEALCDNHARRKIVLGHNRYATSGPPDEKNSQPMLNDREGCWPAARRKVIAFNGNIANADLLRHQLVRDSGISFERETDTEVLLKLITSIDQAQHGADCAEPSDYTALFGKLDSLIDGACSLILIDGTGEMVLYRNSGGIRPLEYIKTESGLLAAASETSAFAGLSGKPQTLEPGSILHRKWETDDVSLTQVAKNTLKFCSMEVLYFGRAGSVNNGVSNNEARRRIGEFMGIRAQEKLEGLSRTEIENITVMPVPNTAIPFATGLADTLGLRYEMGIERQGVQRAFINATQEDRFRVLRNKFLTIKHLIEDRTIWVVDDTLIRKDTSSWITRLLRESGARKVEWFIGAPPFQGACYYGIAVPDLMQLEYWNAVSELPPDLKAKAYDGNEVLQVEALIAKNINADCVTFLPRKLLREAMPVKNDQYCYACFDQNYPTRQGQENFLKNLQALGLK